MNKAQRDHVTRRLTLAIRRLTSAIDAISRDSKSEAERAITSAQVWTDSAARLVRKGKKPESYEDVRKRGAA